MLGTVSQNIYINYDMNKNEITNLVIGSASYLSSNRPSANGLSDKGLLYYDQNLNHIMIWNGSQWKFTQHLDDRDYVSTNNILLENIWTQTNLISTTATTIEEAVISDVVTYSTITMSYIDNSFYFEDTTEELQNLIPDKYALIYLPVVKDIDSITISISEYKIEGNRILFQNGFTDQTNITGYSPAYTISSTQPPTIEFLKYIGTKGSFSFTGALNIIDLPSLSTIYDVRVLPPSVDPLITNNSNAVLNINGLNVFEWSATTSYGTFSQSLLIILTSSISYNIDDLDEIKLILLSN